jgi:peptidoglycan/LPS O-acetylase OafA/YrhL
MQAIKYRPDVDGLRSIAVLSVIFFHFKVPGFGGGYVGVDIFFVISGFLIGSIILRGLESGKFSFLEFYQRRIARLYPAYVAMMCFTSIVAFLLFLPREFAQFGKSVVASVAYVSNILFYRESGYFDASVNLKPLLHTWSLSTEEQFYIFFPVLAYLLFRCGHGKYIVGMLLTIGLISLVMSVYMVDRDSVAAFYLFQFRAWELLVGVIVAFGRIPSPSNYGRANILSAIGLLLIVVAIIGFDEKTAFPGVSALLPCIGAGLVIHSGVQSRPLINQLLSQRGPVFIGLISYSLYLWHWPLIVFARYYALRDLDPLETVTLTAATFACAVLSWRFVERPFRTPANVPVRSYVRFFTISAAVTGLLAGMGIVIVQSKGLPGRLSPETARMAEAAIDFEQNWQGCVDDANPRFPGLAHCAIGNPDTAGKVFLVWGDSHARALKNAIDRMASDSGRSGLVVWGGGCPPLFDIAKHESAATPATDKVCTLKNELVRNLLKSSKKIDAVILIGRWSYYTASSGVGADSQNRIRLAPASSSKTVVADQEKLFADALLATVKQLKEFGVSVYLVEQVPEIPNFDAHRIGVMLRKGDLSPIMLNELTLIDYAEVTKRQGPAMRAFESACTLYGAHLLATHRYFCREGQCSALADGLPAYFDNNHITVRTSIRIKDFLAPTMRPLPQKINASDCPRPV